MTLQNLDELSQQNPRESYAPTLRARQSVTTLQMHIDKSPGYVDFGSSVNDEWMLMSAGL